MEKKYYYVFRTLELEKSEAFILATSTRISMYMWVCIRFRVFVYIHYISGCVRVYSNILFKRK